MTRKTNSATTTVYLIYDGDCILCKNSAQAIKIKKSIGNLEIINARELHPLVKEAMKKGYDLNKGILVKYNHQYFYGAAAVNFLALIGTSSDMFNKVNSFLFKYKWLSQCFYPLFVIVRNTILMLRRIRPIINQYQEPLIRCIFGDQAQKIPNVLQRRYSNRVYTQDTILLKGEINIAMSKIFRIMSPLFRLVGALVPYPAEKIPVTVNFVSDEKSDRILMSRIFYYPDRPPYYFCSRIIHIKDNIVIELMRFGFASKLIYHFDKTKIIMDYGGYVICIGKRLVPIPLGFLIGRLYAFEEVVSNDEFAMQVKMVHPLFGTIFQYDGHFRIATYE